MPILHDAGYFRADHTMDVLTTIEHQTGATPQLSIIWMHGLGADGHDFASAVPVVAPGPDRPTRFIFPTAPRRPVTINGGVEMPAWFDVLGLDVDARVDEQGLRESAHAIEQLIEREVTRGIPCRRIVLAGFSQGGAVALFTALRYPQALAGVIALSTYLPVKAQVDAQASPENRGIPIFMAHGAYDNVLPLVLGEGSCDWLRAVGYDVQWKSYPMEHSVIPEELRDIRRFLCECFDGS